MKSKLNINKLFIRYAWAGTIIGFFLGVGTQLFEFNLKQRNSLFEQIKLETELFDKQQLLYNEYMAGKDDYLIAKEKTLHEPESNPDTERAIEKNNAAFRFQKSKLVRLIREYNSVEIYLSRINNTEPRFFQFDIPISPPTNLRIVVTGTNKDGTAIHAVIFDPAKAEPLVMEAEADLRAMFKQNGHQYPNDEKWIDRNYNNYDMSTVRYEASAGPLHFTNRN